MMLNRLLYSCCFLCLSGCFTGCGKSDSGPTPQELIRMKQIQANRKLVEPKTQSERIEKVESYLKDRNAEAAKRELKPLLISAGSAPEVITLLARCERGLGNIQEAVSILDSIEATNEKERIERLLLAATWATDARLLQLAEEKYEQVLAIDPEHPMVRHSLVQILNEQGKRTEVAEHLQFLVEEGNISEKELGAMMSYREPFQDIHFAKFDNYSELKSDMLYHAMKFRSNRDLNNARTLVKKLAQAFPASAPILAFEGLIYLDFRDHKALADWASRLPGDISEEPTYWFVVGSWLQEQGKHREAIRCFLEAVLRDPTDRFSYRALASSFAVVGENDSSQEANRIATLLDEVNRAVFRFATRPGTSEEILRVAEILDKLGRPYEAIAWRAVELRLHAGTATEMEELNKQRIALQAKKEYPSTQTNSLLSRVHRDKWPLPDLQQLKPSASAYSESSSQEGNVKTEQTAVLPSKAKSSSLQVPIVLKNISTEVGIDFQFDNGDDPEDERIFLYQVNGGGLGVIDFDLDGWPDLYLSQAGGTPFQTNASKSNSLLRNLSGERFVEATENAGASDFGYGQGITAADINQDGFPDLVIANIGLNIVLINHGDGTFYRNLLPSPKADGMWTSSIAIGDLSGDDLPEIFEVNYVDDLSAFQKYCTPNLNECAPGDFRPARDDVLTITKEGAIKPWDGCVDIAATPSYGFAAVIANFDQKNGNDVFVANDALFKQYWVSHERENSNEYALVESAQIFGCAAGMHGQRTGAMGVANGDFDRNGMLDLHVTNFWEQSSDLYLQQLSGLFLSSATNFGLYESTSDSVAWGTQAVDFDRNGWLDLAIINGHVTDLKDHGRPYEQRPQLFQGNLGGFALVEKQSLSGGYWDQPALGRAMAVLDWNRDMRPDLITNHLDVPVALLENQTNGANGVQFELVGTKSERDAIGASISVYCGDQVWTGWITGGDGYMCTNESMVDFGLDLFQQIDRVVITWPSGSRSEYFDLAGNARYLLIEGESAPFKRKAKP